MALRFGTGGFPMVAKGKSADSALETLRSLGLDAMELEFVRRIQYSRERAERACLLAKKLDITLTAHGPYYINLTAETEEKVSGAREMVLDTARAAKVYGARSITFHSGTYRNSTPQKAFQHIQGQVEIVVKELRKESNQVQIRPELTGKSAQFGDFQELIELSRRVPGVFPCIDIAHYHARTGGKMNSYKEFCQMLSALEKGLGKQALADLHMHISGIAYSDKGELHHLNLQESDFNYKDFLKALKEFNCQGVIIVESPNLEEDAVLLKKTYNRL